MSQKIGYIVGSLSKESINRKLARALARLAPEDVELIDIPIGDLPLYNRDFDADYPAVAREFKDAIAAVDGVIIVTPEYSRSIPGALKNALDWASRPWGTNSFARKPTAVIGTSAGGVATAAAQQHLKAILLHLDAIVLGQPEGYIQSTPGLITDDGEVTNPGTAEFLAGYVQAFSDLITRVEVASAADPSA